MKRSTLELWVGIFVALGIAAVVFLSLRVAGGQTVSRHSSYTVSASFTDIGGLKVKAPVKASGVVVGRVSSSQLDPKTYRAKVSLDIDSHTIEITSSALVLEQLIGKFMTNTVEKNGTTQ